MKNKISMKNILLLLALITAGTNRLLAQMNMPSPAQAKAITALIDHYSEAREKSDTTLLKTILTDDIDQLVSSGEWRSGIRPAIEGMLKSSTGSPGKRTLTID